MAILILTPEDSTWTLPTSAVTHNVYGSTGNDSVRLSAGASADLRIFRSGDEVIFNEASSDFTVSRSGSTVVLRSTTNQTEISIAAGLDPVSIQFSDQSTTLVIDPTVGVLLGDQQITESTASVTLESSEQPVVSDDHGDSLADATLFTTNSIGGDIEEAGDTDWFELSLDANNDYQFTVIGDNSAGSELFDPKLNFYSSNGTLLESADDTLGLDPQIDYSAVQSGTYFLEVEGYSTTTGNYTLTSTSTSTPSETVNSGFNYSLTYSNISDFGSYASAIDTQLRAALDYWGQFIVADSNANIEIQINAQASGGLASARSLNLFDTGMNHLGWDVLETGVQTEIREGSDPNGASFDAEINITTAYLSDFWYDPTPLDRQDNTPAFEQFDLMGILLHEFGHALGFSSAYSYPATGSLLNERGFITQWDRFLDWNSSQTDFYFTGSNALSAYSSIGGSGYIPVYAAAGEPGSSLSHYGDFGAEAGLLQGFLINPAVTNGTLLDIAPLDLAILEDLSSLQRNRTHR